MNKKPTVAQLMEQIENTVKEHNETVARYMDAERCLRAEVRANEETIRDLRDENSQLLVEAAYQKRLREESHTNLRALENTLLVFGERDSRLCRILERAAKHVDDEFIAFVIQSVRYALGVDVPREALVGDSEERWDVVLLDARQDAGCRRIYLIKFIREKLRLGLKEAKDLTDPAAENPPRESVLAKGLRKTDAETWLTGAEVSGCHLVLRKSL